MYSKFLLCGIVILTCGAQFCRAVRSNPGTCMSTPVVPPSTIASSSSTSQRTTIPANTNLFCIGTDLYGENWVGIPGKTQTKPCPGNQNGTAKWQCLETGKFLGKTPDYKNCTTKWIYDVGKALEEILDKSNQTIDVTNAFELTAELNRTLELALVEDKNSSSGGNEFFGHEIIEILEIVRDIVSKVNITGPQSLEIFQEIMEGTMHVTDHLLQFQKPWLHISQEDIATTFSSLVNMVSSNGFQFVEKFQMHEKYLGYFKTFGLKRFETSAGILLSGIPTFPLHSEMEDGKNSFLKLPSDWADSLTNSSLQDYIYFTGIIMKSEFLQKNVPSTIYNSETQRFGNSKLINGPMLGFNVREFHDPLEELNGGFVSVHFVQDVDSWGNRKINLPRKLHDGEKPRAVKETAECIQWNMQLNVWTSEGCVREETNTYYTVCKCDTLSNYAVAGEMHEYKGKDVTHLVTTIVAYIFSILVKCKIMYTEWSGTENAEKSARVCAFLFLALSDFLLLTFVDRYFFPISEIWCTFVGVLSHFSLLCSFMFLLVLALDIHLDRREKDEAFNSQEMNKLLSKIQQNKKVSYLLMGFVPPVLILVVTFIAGAMAGPNSRIYGGDFCWLDGPYVWAFFGPGFIIFLIQFPALIIPSSLWVKTKLKQKDEQSGKIDEWENEGATIDEEKLKTDKKKYLKALRGKIFDNGALSLLLLATWTVGFFQFGPYYLDDSFTQHLFPILQLIQPILLMDVFKRISKRASWKDKFVPLSLSNEKFILTHSTKDLINVNKRRHSESMV